MRRLLTGLTVAAVVLGLAALAYYVWTGDGPHTGTWLVTIEAPGEEVAALLVEVTQKRGSATARVLSTGVPELDGSEVETVSIEGSELRLTVQGEGVRLTLAGLAPPGQRKPRRMLGHADNRGRRDFLRWERTGLDTIERKKARTPRKEATQWKETRQMKDVPVREAALRQLVQQHRDVLGYQAGLDLLLSLATEGSADDAEVRERADGVVEFAAGYGPLMRTEALLQVARRLVGSRLAPEVALDYARRAEEAARGQLPPAEEVLVLKMLAAALRKTGRADEAAEPLARAAALEEELDREFLKTAAPFSPEPLPERKSAGNRVVLVELFTGAQCPPCIAADIAFNALLETAPPSDVVLLQYHLHVPGPDPMTNPDSARRADYYGVAGTPSYYINGQEGPPAGGYREHAQSAYQALRDALNAPRNVEAQAALQLTARRQGDRVELRVEVTGRQKANDNVRLRFVLVEERVRYTGRNEQRLHHRVVRAFPGGTDGVILQGASTTHGAAIDLAELRRKLDAYLQGRGFPEEDRPLELERLKAVAFLQDDRTRDVLQAAQVDLMTR